MGLSGDGGFHDGFLELSATDRIVLGGIHPNFYGERGGRGGTGSVGRILILLAMNPCGNSAAVRDCFMPAQKDFLAAVCWVPIEPVCIDRYNQSR